MAPGPLHRPSLIHQLCQVLEEPFLLVRVEHTKSDGDVKFSRVRILATAGSPDQMKVGRLVSGGKEYLYRRVGCQFVLRRQQRAAQAQVFQYALSLSSVDDVLEFVVAWKPHVDPALLRNVRTQAQLFKYLTNPNWNKRRTF